MPGLQSGAILVAIMAVITIGAMAYYNWRKFKKEQEERALRNPMDDALNMVEGVVNQAKSKWGDEPMSLMPTRQRTPNECPACDHDPKQKVHHHHRGVRGFVVACYHDGRSLLVQRAFWIGITLGFPIEHFIWEHVPPFSWLMHALSDFAVFLGLGAGH